MYSNAYNIYMRHIRHNGGFFKFIVLIVVIIVILSILKIDFRGALEESNFNGNIVYVWNMFIVTPAIYFWNNVVVALFNFVSSFFPNSPLS